MSLKGQIKKDHELVIFGSLLNGLFDNGSSDLDLTFIVKQNRDLNHFEELKKVKNALVKSSN